MPVDKFGHTDSGSSQRIVVSGSSSQVDDKIIAEVYNTFLRKDGANLPTADINLDSHKLINVSDPVSGQDGATKNYVDSRITKSVSYTEVGQIIETALNRNVTLPLGDTYLTNKKYVDSINYLLACPTMASNRTVIHNYLYVSSASSIASSRNHSWKAFQNVIADGWIGKTNANEWIQMQYPTSISMSGFSIIARNIPDRNITAWKVEASNDGITFNPIEGPNTTVFKAGVLNKFTFTGDAVSYLYWRFHIISSVGSSDVGIGMLQWTPTYPNPSVGKCKVGYVPTLTSNTNYRGFLPSASSEYSSNYKAANAFKGDYLPGDGSTREWATNGVNENFWIKIKCPSPVRTWKFGFRGRDGNNDNIHNWRIEGSTDDIKWITIHTAVNWTDLHSTYSEYLVDSVVKFQYYRLYCVKAQKTNPGLSTMQLFVYDD